MGQSLIAAKATPMPASSHRSSRADQGGSSSAVATSAADAATSAPPGRAEPVSTPQVDALLDGMKWSDTGLVVAIAQHCDTGAVLMQGFADRDAVSATLASRRATFYSRSRRCLWTKGETSNNFISVTAVYLDCDKDSVIYMGKPEGPTCHTGAETCYYTNVDDVLLGRAGGSEASPPEAHTTFYALEATIAARKREADAAAAASAAPPPPGGAVTAGRKPSWTRRLLDDPALLCSKIREEADELCRTLEGGESGERAALEMADVLYHTMVLLSLKGVKLEDVAEQLRARTSKSGVEEKAGRKKQP